MRHPQRLVVLALLASFVTSGCHLEGEEEPTPRPTAEGQGASSTLDSEDLDHRRVMRFEELLEGRLAGVRVRRLPNGEFSVQIRGSNTLHGSVQPLFVVDGLPVMDTRSLSAINPSDVARIQVLKDASAAAYGVRGANGVILITTRRP